jgi:pSer/pThr/pTyr-binding forkhead associated (FHA) protein
MSGIVLLFLRVVLAVLLYGFLGVGLYQLWRDLRRQTELLAARQSPPLSLRLADETNPRTFAQPEIFLGRGNTCDFLVDDPTISARHARLSFRQGQWWLEDLASRNGTFLNGEALKTPALLTDGDKIRLGQVELVISLPTVSL